MKLEPVSIKNHPTLNEKWVQDAIANDPAILGLGDLIVRDKERIHKGAGRLDLLLQDPESLRRYEIELQLGATDESHIIRTIEYWDIEKKRYPQYEHCAVIIAEEITSRFLNVIHLFNGQIPLIAIKLAAFKFEDKIGLTFTKVIEENRYGLVDEDEPVAESTDRNYWESRSNKQMLHLVDDLLEKVKTVEPKAVLKYNKHYIGLDVNGIANNFVSFIPRKNHIIFELKIEQTTEIDQLMIDQDIDSLPYDRKWSQYRLKISPGQEKNFDVVLSLVRKAYDYYYH